MNQQQIMNILTDAQVIVTDGHFVYTSGKHGPAYFNKDAIYPHTEKTSQLCHELALRLRHVNIFGIDVVIGPALGGIILSQWVAHHLSKMRQQEVLAVYAEKTENGIFIIKRGYDRLIKNKNVLVVEDVLTTGGSARGVVAATREAGGKVVGMGVLCNRGDVTAENVGDVPRLLALVKIQLDAWEPAGCPLCKKGVPINRDAGKGREFLATQ